MSKDKTDQARANLAALRRAGTLRAFREDRPFALIELSSGRYTIINLETSRQTRTFAELSDARVELMRRKKV